MHKTMPLDWVMGLYSGDHGGRMHQFPDGHDGEGWWWSEWDYRKVDEIAASMAISGWDGPPVYISGGELRNGHHRTIAAYLAGIKDIPVTDNWDASEDREGD